MCCNLPSFPIHIAFCLSIGFVSFYRKVIFCFFFDFCLCFHITFIVIFFLYIVWHIFVMLFSFLHLFRLLLLWSLFQKDTFLFIRGRLFICVVIIRITISFISHIICTRAHDAEADHIIDREPYWRCRGDAAGWCASTQQHSHCSLACG